MIREQYQRRLVSQPDLRGETGAVEVGSFSPIKYHHLATYCHISQGVDGWSASCSQMPWELDDKERRRVAEEVASKKVTSKVVDLLIAKDCAERGEPLSLMGDLSYITDLIGEDDDGARENQRRTFTLYRDFFIALDTPEATFPLTDETDGICRSCIGDGSGIGTHCGEYKPPEESKDLVIKGRLERLDGSLVERNGGNLRVKARAFFDRSFFSLVTPTK